MTTTNTKPASERICSCYMPNSADNVPAPRMIEIRRSRNRGGLGAFTVTTVNIRTKIAEGNEYRDSKQAAIDLAASLGYTEVV